MLLTESAEAGEMDGEGARGVEDRDVWQVRASTRLHRLSASSSRTCTTSSELPIPSPQLRHLHHLLNPWRSISPPGRSNIEIYYLHTCTKASVLLQVNMRLYAYRAVHNGIVRQRVRWESQTCLPASPALPSALSFPHPTSAPSLPSSLHLSLRLGIKLAAAATPL